MKASHLFFPTLREAPKEAELTSHQLLLRGGFIRNLASGVYSYLPLGWRVHEKISRIVREEINAIGGQEIHMPVLVPRELLDETGRSAVPVLFALKDKNEREFFLGFTHEEVVTDIVRGAISSWKQMPLYLYQIQTKERDEPRPRGGLIRAREFTMFDGYSFDIGEKQLDTIYDANYRAYANIFTRCGLEFLSVEADPGAIGGTDNLEFMVLAESGEDTVLRCDSCDYAANAERAEVPEEPVAESRPESRPSEVVPTPGARTVEQVCAFLNIGPEQLIKTILCVADDRPVAGLVRGDRELNLTKFARFLGAAFVDLADAATVERVTGAPVGFAGPVGLSKDVPIYADNELKHGANYVVGANQADAHRINVTPGHDFAVTQWGDIRTAIAGDRCPRCNGHLREARGIEVGHIFQLGTKYSKDMGALYQNETGEKKPILMGCYGLGVSRTMAAAVEVHHDENGILWPISIAPFEVAILIANSGDAQQSRAAHELYSALQMRHVETLLDDREERIGVKFKDMDLIGVPVQVIVGKGLAEGKVEVGLRREKTGRQTVPVQEAAQYIANLVAEEKARLQLAG
ncbi:MAG TPA: proline--tRNA ligase [Chthonomonadaceae bacterium]|nr:proline--tRNA ligase [Chthonomonadaceae bacterium]